jgi:hypothetical protein
MPFAPPGRLAGPAVYRQAGRTATPCGSGVPLIAVGRDRAWHQGWADAGTAGLRLLPLLMSTGTIRNCSWILLAEDNHHHAA